MTASDTLLYAADLELLYDAFNDLLEAEREELSNPERVARIVYKFERFVSIHEVRTGDIITLKDRLEKAGNEYRALKLRYDGMTDRYNQSKELLNKVLNDKV